MDARVTAAHLPVPHASEYPDHWLELFRNLDEYDWNDPTFKKLNKGKFAFRPIPLTKGYFMIVAPRNYRRMTLFPDGKKKKWHARERLDEKNNLVSVYACRRGRGDEPKDVYAHRELRGCIFSSVPVDHVNGYGLDNRMEPNLRVTNRNGENNHNAVRQRTVHLGLPPGVERCGPKDTLYRGIRSIRLGPKKVLTIRSKRMWKTPEPAARWYQNQLKKLHNRVNWAHSPTTVNFPKFPPRMEQEPEYRLRPVAMRIEIPF